MTYEVKVGDGIVVTSAYPIENMLFSSERDG